MFLIPHNTQQYAWEVVKISVSVLLVQYELCFLVTDSSP